jgi:hypothetical protein
LHSADPQSYSVFDFALYKNQYAERPFPQEKAALQNLKTSIGESKTI